MARQPRNLQVKADTVLNEKYGFHSCAAIANPSVVCHHHDESRVCLREERKSNQNSPWVYQCARSSPPLCLLFPESVISSNNKCKMLKEAEGNQNGSLGSLSLQQSKSRYKSLVVHADCIRTHDRPGTMHEGMCKNKNAVREMKITDTAASLAVRRQRCRVWTSLAFPVADQQRIAC